MAGESLTHLVLSFTDDFSHAHHNPHPILSLLPLPLCVLGVSLIHYSFKTCQILMAKGETGLAATGHSNSEQQFEVLQGSSETNLHVPATF